LAKGTGSFASFLGIKATGASGLAAVFTAAAVGGGDTGRVADCGKEPKVILSVLGLVGATLAAFVTLFAAGVLSLDMIDPTKTGFEATSAVEIGATGSFVPSLSFCRFVSGSRSRVATLAGSDGSLMSGLETS
jgi:hypothetical protein